MMSICWRPKVPQGSGSNEGEARMWVAMNWESRMWGGRGSEIVADSEKSSMHWPVGVKPIWWVELLELLEVVEVREVVWGCWCDRAMVLNTVGGLLGGGWVGIEAAEKEEGGWAASCGGRWIDDLDGGTIEADGKG